ncbi:NAC domain-containing protein 1-like [Populus alba x Populus x berolinensis]|nr:NAC domain-containing protein 1-like [Populus alba x Populus x berolinensis]
MEDQRRSGAGLTNPGLVQGDQYPPGYRFKPKDQELISCYLLCKIRDRPLPRNGIHEVTLYKYSPETLIVNYEPYGDKEWYFLTPRDRKYPNGDRPNRAAGDGYWKATGADIDVTSANRVIGSKKTLVFHRGKAPGGDKTNWIMHEYRASNSDRAPKRTNDGMRLDEWVLCRIHNRNDSSPRNRINGLQDDEIEDQPWENNENLVPQQVVVPSTSGYHNPGSSYGNSVSAFPQNSQNGLVAGVSQNHEVYIRNPVTGNYNPGSQMGYLDSHGNSASAHPQNSQNGLVAGVSQDHAITSVPTVTGNYNPVSQMGYLHGYGNFASAYPRNSQNGLARVSQDNALPGIPQTTNLQKTILDYEIGSFQFGDGR